MTVTMPKPLPRPATLAPETRLVGAGSGFGEHGFVNPAVYHGSTVLFPTAAAFRAQDQPYL